MVSIFMTSLNGTKDYSQSPAPAFDAVEDIKALFAASNRNWDTISRQMATIKDASAFAQWADYAGIQGYPVEAWYDLYNGQGSYKKFWLEHDTNLLKQLEA